MSDFVQHWMKGVADMVGTTYGDAVEMDADGGETLTARGLGGLLERCPVALTGVLSTGGSVGLMFPEDIGARLADIGGAEGAEGDATLDDGRLSVLRDLAGMILSAGMGQINGVTGQNIEVDDASAALFSPGDAAQLAESFGAMEAASFRWAFESGVGGEGMFVYSASAAGTLSGGRGAAQEPIVSDDEMKDILSGFGSDDTDAGGNGSQAENLDVILGIELIATARLGRVEMPIAEILSLGPGSIVEVGQFVDEPIELLVNNRLVARGDVVVVDEKFGLRITEIVSRKERIESLR